MVKRVRLLRVAKLCGDAEAADRFPGRFMGLDSFPVVLAARDGDADGVWRDEASGGRERVLFRVRRGVLGESLRQAALDAFLAATKPRSSSRGLAAGLLAPAAGSGQPARARVRDSSGFSGSAKVASHISGYFDRPEVGSPQRADADGKLPCRTTAFTRSHPDLWRKGLPFVQAVDALYRRLAPQHHAAQAAHAARVPAGLTIEGTVFSTVTSNYNWRTAAHRDAGDFAGGLGNLAVVGGGFRGCCLAFPQFGVALEVEPGDFVLMDTHQWHCNTELHLDAPDAVRMSFVCYLRQNMADCRAPQGSAR